jgi:hypothetical protein
MNRYLLSLAPRRGEPAWQRLEVHLLSAFGALLLVAGFVAFFLR